MTHRGPSDEEKMLRFGMTPEEWEKARQKMWDQMGIDLNEVTLCSHPTEEQIAERKQRLAQMRAEKAAKEKSASAEDDETEAEFARMMSAEDLDQELNNVASEYDQGFSGKMKDISQDVEDDLRALEHMESHRACAGNIALVVTNLLEPLPLETMMAADRIVGEVVETETGCVVWREISQMPEDEFAALLGEERPVPPEADELARKISQITPYGAVLFVSNLAEENETDPGVHGQIIGRVYYDGKFERTIPPGPMIACSDERLEDLLLGRTKPQDYPRETAKSLRLRDMPSYLLRQAREILMTEREARQKTEAPKSNRKQNPNSQAQGND